MEFYNIYAGLGGGFGGCNYQYTAKFMNLDEAVNEAYLEAREIYESYEGRNGIQSWDDFKEDYMEQENIFFEEDLTDEDRENISDMYVNEVEGWLAYKAVHVNDDDLEINELDVR